MDVIESIATIPNSTDNQDEVWMVVNRANGRYIERMVPKIISSVDGNNDTVAILEDQIRVDSCVTYNSAATIFEGLDHLEDEIVSILGDGTSVTASTVNDGSLTTSSSYTKVAIGLPVYSDFETLDINIGLENGTVQGSQVKVGNVTFSFVDSRGGWLGPDQDNIYNAFIDEAVSHNQSELIFSPSDYDWSSQDIDSPAPYLYTGYIRRPIGAGYRKGGRVFFRQVSPYPVTISQVLPEIDPGGNV